MNDNTTTLDLCQDCVQLLANAEVTDSSGNDRTAEHAAEMDATWGADLHPGAITLGCTDTECEDTEGWFSYSPCDGCGSTLGGHREHGTYTEKRDEPTTDHVAPAPTEPTRISNRVSVLPTGDGRAYIDVRTLATTGTAEQWEHHSTLLDRDQVEALVTALGGQMPPF